MNDCLPWPGSILSPMLPLTSVAAVGSFSFDERFALQQRRLGVVVAVDPVMTAVVTRSPSTVLLLLGLHNSTGLVRSNWHMPSTSFPAKFGVTPSFVKAQSPNSASSKNACRSLRNLPVPLPLSGVWSVTSLVAFTW